jgi:hypothetical protein
MEVMSLRSCFISVVFVSGQMLVWSRIEACAVCACRNATSSAACA